MAFLIQIKEILNPIMASPLSCWMLTALITVATIWILAPNKKKSSNEAKQRALPPMYQGGFLHTLRNFFSKELHTFLLDLARTHSKILRLPLGTPSKPFCMVADVTATRTILQDPTSQKWFPAYEAFDVAFGGPNFFSSESERYYKHTRRNHCISLGPQYAEQLSKDVQSSLNEWMDETFSSCSTDGGTVVLDIAHTILLLTTSAFGRAAFEYELSREDRDLMVESIELAYVEAFIKQQSNPLRKFLPAVLLPGKRRAQQATRDMHSVCLKMLQHYRARSDGADKKKTTLLSFMVQDEAYGSDQERLIDMVGYYAGGLETGAYTMAWTMLELVRNHEMQTKLRKELTNNSTVFLKQVIRESMRLHPVAAAGSLRTISKDLVVGEYTLPKGSICVMPLYAMHRDPEIFTDPDIFMPQRWEAPTKEQSAAFMPFALGRRNCKGQLLANIEMELIISRLISEYEWTVVDEGHAEYSITLKTIETMLQAKRIKL